MRRSYVLKQPQSPEHAVRHLLSAGVAPGQVAVDAVGGPAHHLATDVLELLDAVAERDNLRGANECEVQRPGKEYLCD